MISITRHALKSLSIGLITSLPMLVMAEQSPAGESLTPDCPHCPEMVRIPAGSFEMGDTKGVGGEDEQPTFSATIAAFAISRYEVTFDEYDVFAKATRRQLPKDLGWGRGNRPVIMVSWQDARAYVTWLSEETGLPFRLPSETEWQYAAVDTNFEGDIRTLCQHANHADASTNLRWRNIACRDGLAKMTSQVGRYKANSFGLHDMHGNVYEWVEDCYVPDFNGAPTDGSARQLRRCEQRVMKGGSWYNHPNNIRASNRAKNKPTSKSANLGFRIAMDLPASTD